MLTYFVRRLLVAIPTLIAISMVCYVVINLPAGDIVDDYELRLVELQRYSVEAARQAGEQLRHEYGLSGNIAEKYLHWATHFLRGDFGISLSTMEAVVNIIGPRIEFTLLISLLSLMLSWGVGIAIGVYCATHQGSVGDYMASFVGLVTLSVPPFLTGLGLLVLIVLAFNAPLPIGLFSAEYTSAPWSIGKLLDLLWHLWIPVIVVGMTGAASVMRMMRANLLDEVRKQYVETARAKGLKERRVIYRHAVRIAINPLIALLGVEFPLVISNGIVISIVLGLPTIGPVLQESLVARDVYVASAILMLLGALLVIGNLVSDLLLAWIDPRIRFS